MTKPNYTKALDAFDERLYRMKKNELLRLADLASENKLEEEQAATSFGQMLILITYDLKWMQKKDPEIYKRLGISKKELRDIETKIHGNIKLTKAETELLTKTLKSVVEYRSKNFPSEPEEKQIESERKKHINKRFNVNEKWLPLK